MAISRQLSSRSVGVDGNHVDFVRCIRLKIGQDCIVLVPRDNSLHKEQQHNFLKTLYMDSQSISPILMTHLR